MDLKVKPADKKAGTGPTVTFTITADDNTVLATGTVFPPPMPAPATQPPFATSHPEGNGTKTDVGWHGTKPAWLHIYCPGKDEKGKSAHLQVFDDPTVEINLSEEDQTALIGFLKKHFVVKETAGAGETKPPK